MKYIDFEGNTREMTKSEEKEYKKLLKACGNPEAALSMLFGEGTGKGKILKRCTEPNEGELVIIPGGKIGKVAAKWDDGTSTVVVLAEKEISCQTRKLKRLG